MGDLRLWCVARAIAYCEATLRKGMPVEDIGCLAGWDACYALLHGRWLVTGEDVADVAGVDPKTYRKARNAVFVTLLLRLRALLVIEQPVELDDVPVTAYGSGRGFNGDFILSATGCAVTPKRDPEY